MTREEAISEIRYMLSLAVRSDRRIDALNLAVEALRQEERWNAERVEYIKTINKWGWRWQELREWVNDFPSSYVSRPSLNVKMDSLVADKPSSWLREMGGF